MKPRRVDKPLLLYGYGKLGMLAEEIFTELKIPITSIFDRNSTHAYLGEFLVAVCVASEPYWPIENYLHSLGFSDVAPVWDIIEAYPQVGIHNGWFVGEYSKEDDRETDNVLDGLSDNKSRNHYLEFFGWHNGEREERYVRPPKEPLPSTLVDIRNRQKVMLWSNRRMPRVSIHVEGKELETLEENITVFKKRRPAIDIACYHSRDGLWKIPKFLMGNLEFYQFKFRMHAYMGQAAIMYCTPKERL